MTRPITVRTAETKSKLERPDGFSNLCRIPKAFYLNEAHAAAFTATNPGRVSASFRGIVTSEPGFDGVPVRRAQSANALRPSKLYSGAGTSIQVLVA